LSFYASLIINASAEFPIRQQMMVEACLGYSSSCRIYVRQSTKLVWSDTS